MFAVTGQYGIRPGAAGTFRDLYDPAGDWMALFREPPGGRSAELLRSEIPGHELTIDRRDSAAAGDALLAAAKPRHAAPEARGDALTVEAHRIGRDAQPC